MEVISFTPKDQLIEQLHNTTMLTDRSVFPYKNAIIRAEDIDLDDFLPTQLYILKEHMETQRILREELLEKGYDTLRLFGKIVIRNSGIITTMIPPILEDDCEFGPCLLDGTHRAYLARLLGIKSLGVLHISGVSKETPMISLPNQWSDIIEYETMSAVDRKKYYRNLPDKYNYYRDFSEITGVGKDPRSKITMELQNA